MLNFPEGMKKRFSILILIFCWYYKYTCIILLSSFQSHSTHSSTAGSADKCSVCAASLAASPCQATTTGDQCLCASHAIVRSGAPPARSSLWADLSQAGFWKRWDIRGCSGTLVREIWSCQMQECAGRVLIWER